MIAVAAVAFALTLTSGSQTQYCSCHLCHDRKRVVSRLFLGWPVSWHESMDTQFPTSADHQHAWWNHTVVIFPVFWPDESVETRLYVDGSPAPDGPP
jgi:hypothetical protein